MSVTDVKPDVGESLPSPEERGGNDGFVEFIAESVGKGRIEPLNAERLLDLDQFVYEQNGESAFDEVTVDRLHEAAASTGETFVAPLLRRIDDFIDGERVHVKLPFGSSPWIEEPAGVSGDKIQINSSGVGILLPPTYPGLIKAKDFEKLTERKRTRGNTGHPLPHTFAFELSRRFDSSVDEKTMINIKRKFY